MPRILGASEGGGRFLMGEVPLYPCASCCFLAGGWRGRRVARCCLCGSGEALPDVAGAAGNAARWRLGWAPARIRPLGFDLAQQSTTTRPSVESTAEKASMLVKPNFPSARLHADRTQLFEVKETEASVLKRWKSVA